MIVRDFYVFASIEEPLLVHSLAVGSVLVAAMGFKITKLRKLTKISFRRSCGKSEVAHNIFRSDFFFVGHKLQYIDQFLCQGWLYRPLIDHGKVNLSFSDYWLRFSVVSKFRTSGSVFPIGASDFQTTGFDFANR